VKAGSCSVSELKRAVNYFMTHELFRGRPPPPLTNRRFFPKKKNLQNHFYRAYVSGRESSEDQVIVHLLVEKWRAEGNVEDRLFFRPYSSGESRLMYVHQLHWQRRLLLRYGQNICLLNATFKTSKFALRLFFVCVPTNCRYMVVASVIVQEETTVAITEALAILKQWNPVWNPAAFMTDNCDAEIGAIKATFSGKRHYRVSSFNQMV
jgi:hypothetical protein